MEKFKIRVMYGWTEWELEYMPYHSVDTVEANTLEEAIAKKVEELNKPQNPDSLYPNGYPFYWELVDFDMKGSSGGEMNIKGWLKDGK